jgi:alanine racemase
VAVVAAGYADGVFRTQSHRAVLLGDVRCPIIGRVSMDQISIDVSAVADARPGDAVTLIGGREGVVMSADEVAAASGTLSHEVLCAVSARVPRVVTPYARS